MKKRQVTDNIHGTVYLSELESDLISTPYFYRLNDIYQSSTVYMTFPSNRTKRYEHSLGTMELTSSMLFSSINNANLETKKILFQHLKICFQELCNLILACDAKRSVYFSGCSKEIDQLFDRIKASNKGDLDIVHHIEVATAKGAFKDFALDNFQYYPIENGSTTMNLLDEFLYRCMLQSLRVIALFHDVGHPPYSHILEEVLINLYKLANSSDSKTWDSSRKSTLISCLKPYLSEIDEDAYHCDRFIVKKSSQSTQPHERIGLSLLQSALDDIISDKIQGIVYSKEDDGTKLALITYYITIAEFSTAIVVDHNNFFSSFHKMIDGVLDADRLDYIVRDMNNSGVDWGKIPYKRVVNSSKLITPPDDLPAKSEDSSPIFAVAFPRKITDDIEDLLLVRYKIFARINFHHRCMKTATALQSSVQDLALNYLIKNEVDINPDISTLWCALGTTIGDRKIRIIKWNDSWLISALHTALINLKSGGFGSQYDLLRENLEEILLNKKRYFSLLKRGDDNREFVKKIFENAEITQADLDILLTKEHKKFFLNSSDNIGEDEILCSPHFDANDSIQRITTLMQIREQGNLELLQGIFPLNVDGVEERVDAVIESSLKKLKEDGAILDYKIIINSARGKMGLPKHKNLWDEIYLYNNDLICKYDEQELLAPQIKSIEKTVSWLYVYFVPSRETVDIATLCAHLKDVIARDVALRFKARYEELFPNKIGQTLTVV